jgi:hypothetical protein
VALLLPAVQQVREAARKAQCQDHLHNLAIAVMNYEGAHRIFPMGSYGPVGPTNPYGTGPGGSQGWGWGAYILPFTEQKPLYDTIGVGTRHLRQAIADTTVLSGRANLQKQIDVFVCPSDSSSETMQGMTSKLGFVFDQDWSTSAAGAGFFTATANYVANFGHMRFGACSTCALASNRPNTGAMHRNSSYRVAHVTDGLSNTFLIGERDQEGAGGTWVGVQNGTGSGPKGANYVGGNVYMKPNDLVRTATQAAGGGGAEGTITPIYGFSSKHPGGTQFALGDGKVTFLSENIDHNNNYCAANGTTCSQDQNVVFNSTSTGTFNGQPIGVYQRLGIIYDGLPVRVP